MLLSASRKVRYISEVLRVAHPCRITTHMYSLNNFKPLFCFKVTKPGKSCRFPLPDDPESLKYIKKCSEGLACVYKSYKPKDSLKYGGKCISESDLSKCYC